MGDVPTKLGRYRVVDLLARGGMGSVYLARATGIGGFARPVAVKLLHRHLAGEKQVVDMFLAEARLAARISHRNVVDVLDVDMLEGEHLIAMRFVEGGSLRQLVQARGEQKLPAGVALRIVHDTLLGLHAAHEAKAESGAPLGIIHRDVSPSNILVDLDGVAQLGDFGVARAAGGVVSSLGTVKGKLRYLAPEQATGGALDRRVDVFAAGVVLWELLAGRTLFHGENDAETIHKILEAPIPPPNGPTLAVDEVCLKALERDPARRYETAEALAKALATAGERVIASHEDVAKVAREAFGADVDARRAALAKDATEEPSSLVGETTTGSAMALSVASAKKSRAPFFAVFGVASVLLLVGIVGFVVSRKPEVPVSRATPAAPEAPPVVSIASSSEPPERPPVASSTQERPAVAAPRSTQRRPPPPPTQPVARPAASVPSGPYIPPSL